MLLFADPISTINIKFHQSIVPHQVMLNDNPVEVLADQGLPEGLEPLLECVRQVKLGEQDAAIVLPYLLCSLLASEEVLLEID